MCCGWAAYRGLGHVLHSQLHEGLLPGFLQDIEGSNDCHQDLEQPESVSAGDLWRTEALLRPWCLTVTGDAKENTIERIGKEAGGREHMWTHPFGNP